MNNNYHEKSINLQFRNPASLLGCLLLAGVLAACSSVKNHVDKGPVKAGTFSFLNTGSK